MGKKKDAKRKNAAIHVPQPAPRITPRYWFIAATSALVVVLLVCAYQRGSYCIEEGPAPPNPGGPFGIGAEDEDQVLCLRSVESGRYKAPLNSSYAIYWMIALGVVLFAWWRWEQTYERRRRAARNPGPT